MVTTWARLRRDFAFGAQSATLKLWAAMAFSVLLIAAFLAPWWRSYLGLTLEGYFPLYGHFILEGKIPYRDFFLHLPPLHALFDAAIQFCFGKSLLVLRVVGAAERLLMAALLVFWLSRIFRLAPALFGSVAAIVVASGDDTEILDLYNYHALLAALLAGIALSRALRDDEGASRAWYLAGFFASLSFWMKQTIGLHATLAVVLLPLVLGWRSPEARQALGGRLRRIVLGWLPVSLLIGGWLAANGAFSAFLRQTFLDAAASKGSPLQLLVRPWLDPLRVAELRLPALLALLCVVLLVIGARLPQGGEESRKTESWGPLLATAGLFAAILVASHAILHPIASRVIDLRWVQRIGVLIVSYGILWPAAVLALRAARRELAGKEAQLLAFVLVSGGTASALGFSWPAGEALAFPGLALLAALALEAAPTFRWSRLLRVPLLVAVASASLAVATQKMIHPFDFAMWREPSPEDSDRRSADPALAGLWLGARTQEAVDGTLGVIRKASRPDEPIFVFSDMPIFYWLTDRPVLGFAALSWFDVTPDRIVDADAATLRASPPPVIVFHQLSGSFLQVNEDYFRDGRESALRRMQEDLYRMSGDYLVAAYYEPWKRYPPLQVWVRRDRAAEVGIEEYLREPRSSALAPSPAAGARSPS